MKRAVREAKAAGLVSVVLSGRGQGAKAVVYPVGDNIPCPVCGLLPARGHAAFCTTTEPR